MDQALRDLLRLVPFAEQAHLVVQRVVVIEARLQSGHAFGVKINFQRIQAATRRSGTKRANESAAFIVSSYAVSMVEKRRELRQIELLRLHETGTDARRDYLGERRIQRRRWRQRSSR